MVFESSKICNSKVCIKDAARMHSWMNRSVEICENFSEHVCGTLTDLVRSMKEVQ